MFGVRVPRLGVWGFASFRDLVTAWGVSAFRVWGMGLGFRVLALNLKP